MVTRVQKWTHVSILTNPMPLDTEPKPDPSTSVSYFKNETQKVTYGLQLL